MKRSILEGLAIQDRECEVIADRQIHGSLFVSPWFASLRVLFPSSIVGTLI